MSDERWGYADSEFAETWTGCYANREDAIADGAADACGEPFWIHSGHLVPLEAVMPDVDDIIETMGDRACDEAGEVAEEYPDLSLAAKAELRELLYLWAEKYAKPTFWVADGEAELIPAVPEKP